MIFTHPSKKRKVPTTQNEVIAKEVIGSKKISFSHTPNILDTPYNFSQEDSDINMSNWLIAAKNKQRSNIILNEVFG